MHVTSSALSLNVEAPETSARFFREYFGFRVAMEADGFVSLQRDDVGFNLIFLRTGLPSFRPTSHAATVSGGLLLALVVDDIDAQFERLRELGAPVVTELQTEPWGVKVSIVEVKDIELPQSMQRAMAQQAEAERDKRAKIIRAEGEFLASQQLADAANVISENPIALQLRYLQTVSEIGTENSTSIVFPIPIDMLNGLIGGLSGNTGGNPNGPAPTTPTITVLEPRPSPDEPRT